MATSANPPPGATPTHGNGSDPFVSTPSQFQAAQLRYSTLDNDQFTSYATDSPAQARRALEAHLKETDRRIHDAAKLGNTLLEQKKTLAARLKEVESVERSDEVPTALRQKLADLEKEYNEVGRESARAFLPKLKNSTSDSAATMLSGQGGASPSKLSAPSRRQRNQPGARVHDIEFATEISTSLLAQVRQLQAALAEKDGSLKDTASAKAQLEADIAALTSRVKSMDERSQSYKDENWNLETRLQELEGAMRQSVDKEQRLTTSLKATQADKAAAQRDLDDLKMSHDNAIEAHTAAKRQQDTDLHTLRRDAASHETEKQALQRKIDELNNNNKELAKAVSYRFNQSTEHSHSNDTVDKSDDDQDEPSLDNIDMSPVKGTPARPGMLESETLKSSLNHAHRMIQNLKNNIHREKTEKVELKRMLSEARDELERKRSDNGPARAGSERGLVKRRAGADRDGKGRRVVRVGANGLPTTEIIDGEPEWEDHEGSPTPSKSRNFATAAATAAAVGVAGSSALHHISSGDEDTESTDAFETADELRDTTTENEGFETGAENFGDESEELTETEGGLTRNTTVRRHISPLASAPAGDRRSYLSTASTSADEDDDDIHLKTPNQNQGPKYRLRMSRGARRSLRQSQIFSDSPASNNSTPQNVGKSLGDELDALDDDSVEGTPSKSPEEVGSAVASPESSRFAVPIAAPGETSPSQQDQVEGASREELDHQNSSPVSVGQLEQPHDEQAVLAHQANAAMLAHESAVTKPAMVDAGIMTEPWEPERTALQGGLLADKEVEDDTKQPSSSIGEKIAGVASAAGGALAGFGLGRMRKDKDQTSDATLPIPEDTETREVVPASGEQTRDAAAPLHLTNDKATTNLVNNTTDAVVPLPLPNDKTTSVPANSTPDPVKLQPSAIISQESVPIAPATAKDEFAPVKPATKIANPILPHRNPQSLTFSGIVAQAYEPASKPQDDLRLTPTPVLPTRSSRRVDGLSPTASAKLLRRRSSSMPASFEEDAGPTYIEPKVYGGGKGANGIPTLTFGDDESDDTQDLVAPRDASPSMSLGERNIASDGVLPVTRPLQVKKPVLNSGSQTVVSGRDIEELLRDKSSILSTGAAIGAATFAATKIEKPALADTLRHSMDSNWPTFDASRAPRRPASVGSMRNKAVVTAPPLPPDHTEKIAKAAKSPAPPLPAPGLMGPPIMPASAYRTKRPTTPGERVNARSLSRDGTTPRPPRGSTNEGSMSGRLSRSTSISSFASELDERFNINRAHLAYPDDVAPPTDPRMIQAITQTMIGEFLWKYTRKAGRTGTSTIRHRRFFWVHPYTRTLYWSVRDPASGTKDTMKAKSVPIESVRVVSDDNAYPPGLHRKSLVIVTPAREVVVTAPTSQRHETWFNALSYLLVRTDAEKEQANDAITEDDLDEFNPRGFSIRRSISRMTGGRGRSHSRVSASSYNSRATRNSSPTRQRDINTMAERQAAAAQRASVTSQPPHASLNSRSNAARDSSRFSSLASRLVPSNSMRGSMSSANNGRSSLSSHGNNPEIYNASVVGESAEDLRKVIEKQEKDSDMLENVRACCDGKHDVGSLSRNSKHASLRSRTSNSHINNSQTHTHAYSTAEPIQTSLRPRRGE